MVNIESKSNGQGKEEKGNWLQRSTAMKMALYYAMLGSLWIFFSDKLLDVLLPDSFSAVWQKIYEDWFYVGGTATLLWLMLERFLKKNQESIKQARESEARFSKVFHANPAGINIFRLSDNLSVDVNDAFLDLIGYSRDEVIGHSAAELNLFIDPRMREIWIDALRKNKRVQNLDADIRCKDGTIKNALASIDVVDINGVAMGLVITSDITERKLIGSQNAKLTERLDLATRSGRLGIWDWDIQKNELVWDEQMYALYGHKLGQFPGAYEAWLNGLHPDDRELSIKVSQQAVRGAGEYDTEFRVLWPDGSTHWLKADAKVYRDEQGNPTRMVGVNYDITTRKQAEEAVRKYAEQLKVVLNIEHTLASSLDEGVIYVNLSNGVRQLFPDIVSTFISRFDAEKSLIKAVYGIHEGVEVDVSALPELPLAPEGQGTQSKVIHSRQPLIVNSKLESNLKQGMPVRIGSSGQDSQSALYVPVVVQNRVLGLIQVQSIIENRFTDEDTQSLTLIANAAAVSLENARLYTVSQSDITERKKSEEALRRSERVLRLFVEHSPASIAMFDRDMKYIVASRRYLQDYELGEQDLTGRSHYEVFPEIPERWKEIHRRCLKGAIEKAEEDPFVRMNGELDWVHWEIHPWYEDDETIGGVILFSEVITERKNSQQKLRESEERYQQFITQSFEGISRTEFNKPVDTSLPVEEQIDLIYDNAYMAEANQAMADMYHVPLTAFIGTRLIDAHGGRDNPVNREVFRKFIENGYKSINDETIEYALDGKPTWFLSNTIGSIDDGKLVRLWGTCIEITDRKLAEQSLHESEEKYRTLINSTADGVFVAQDEKFVFCNPSLPAMLGYLPGEFENMPFSQVVAPAHLKIWLERFKQRVSGNDVVSNYQVQFIDKTGTKMIWMELRASIINYQGRPAVLGIVRDITEHKAILEQMENLAKFPSENPGPVMRVNSDGKLLYANEASVALLSEWALTVGKQAPDGLLDIAMRVLDSGLDEVIETIHNERVVTLNFFLLQHGSYVNVYGRDITEQKLAEARLRQSEERYRYLFENNPHPMWAYDLNTLRFLAVNDAAVAKYGYSREEFMQMTIKDIRPNEDLDHLTAHLSEKRPDLRHSGEWRHKLKDGSVIDVDISSHRVKLGSNEASLVVALDITDRKLAERELRESEIRFRQLAESIQEIFWMFDHGLQRIIYINPAYEVIWGHTVESLYQNSRQYIESLHPEDRATMLDAMEKQARGELTEVEYRVVHPDGSIRWISDRAFPIFNEQGVVVRTTGIAADITRRKLAEIELRESENKFRNLSMELEERVRQRTAEVQDLYDNAPAGYHSLDRHGRFITINQTEADWLGYKREELLGLSFKEVVTPQSAMAFEENFPIFLQRGWVNNLEYDMLRKDGTTFPVVVNATVVKNEQGEYLMSRSTVFDHSESKQAENALRESEAQNRLLFEEAPNAVILFDGHGKVIRVNKACVNLLGISEHEIIGHSLGELNVMPADQVKQLLEAALYSFDANEDSVSAEFKIRSGTGEIRDVNVLVFALKIRGVDHYLASIYDVTTRARAEDTLRSANSELERVMRMKDEFLASMSHELRTPLTGILGLSEALQMNVYGALNEKQRTALSNVETSGRHLLELINDILDISKIDADKLELQMEPCSLSDICQSSIQLTKGLANKKLQNVSFSVDSADSLVRGDVRRLKQIFVNLLSNAVKFTPEGGSLGLNVTTNLDDQIIKVVVWDNGIGISPENLKKLFQPFVQLDSSLSRQQVGTGLGLALVKRLVDLHGGSVEVESAPDVGSRFTVCLPYVPFIPKQKLPEKFRFDPAKAAAASLHMPVVMVVDDNEVNVNTLGDFLTAQNYTVISSSNGFDFLARVADVRPDIILLDIQMPGMDGLEALRRLRAMPDPFIAAIPVITVTALAMPGDRERCLEAGANEYLSKPVVLRELNGIVQTHMRKMP